MRTPSRIRRIGVAAIASACLLSGVPVLAQGGGILNPNAPTQGGNTAVVPESAAPQPTVRKQYPVWVGYIVIFVIVAAIMGVSLIPSKRSHQD